MPCRNRAARGGIQCGMRRLLPFLLLVGALTAAPAVRLYLKDGGFQTAREYEVLKDRVRYLSAERNEWEELPLDLVDLDRTRRESVDRDAARKKEAEAIDAEDKAEREQREELERIPYEPGVYQVDGTTVKSVKQAEVKAVGNKRRNLLKVITPIPIVAGQNSVEIDGLQASYAVANRRPYFYFRLSADERYAIVKLLPLKKSRRVETWDVIPVSNEIVQKHEAVPIFRRQLTDNLFQIWPEKPLEPGEYAVIQFTEGKANTQAWDFRVP